jgi:hypothetical protein
MSTSVLKGETSKYQCIECDKSFKEKGNLKTHLRKHVIILKPRPVKNLSNAIPAVKHSAPRAISNITE